MLCRRTTVGFAAALAALLCLAGTAVADPYAEAFGRSYEYENGGRYGRAIEVLEPLLAEYPQDSQLALRLGWLYYQNKNYGDAEEQYGRALTLSPESVDSWLGRGWSRFYQGKKSAARDDFDKVLELSPGHESAAEGLALCAPVYLFVPSVSGVYYAYTDHPVKESATGVVLSLPTLLADRFLLGAAYRYTRFRTRQDGFISAWDEEFTQQEMYGHAGVTFPSWGLTAQYGRLSNDMVGEEPVSAAGASLRVSPWGNIRVSGSGSFYTDETVYRTAAAWDMPLGGRFLLIPGAAYQQADGESYATGYLSASAPLGPVSVVVGAKYGEEYKPAYLEQAVVYNTPETIQWGGWCRAAMVLGGGMRLAAFYEFQKLRLESGAETVEPGFHVMVLTLGWSSRKGK